MSEAISKGIWYPNADFVMDVVTRMVPILFPNYDVSEPDFEFLGGEQGQGLLESSLARPMPYFGVDRYPSIADKAGALIWSITLNHPFNDGNKRAALTTAFVFLVSNKHMIFVNQDEAVEMCLRVAANTPGYTEAFVSRWIQSHIVSVAGYPDGVSLREAFWSNVLEEVSPLLSELTNSQLDAWLSFYEQTIRYLDSSSLDS